MLVTESKGFQNVWGPNGTLPSAGNLPASASSSIGAELSNYDPVQHREHTKRDLLQKFAREDWHGVADAAMDLRDIDAFMAGRQGAPYP